MDTFPTSRNDRELLPPPLWSPRSPTYAYSFVFNNYTWSAGPLPYAHWRANIIPSRIPMSAMIAGKPDAEFLAAG